MFKKRIEIENLESLYSLFGKLMKPKIVVYKGEEYYVEFKNYKCEKVVKLLKTEEEGFCKIRAINLNFNVANTLISYGYIIYDSFCKEFKLDRSDGPAFIKEYKNFENELMSPILRDETWYKDDRISRKDGPAFVRYDGFGNILKKRYFIDGQEIDEFKAAVMQASYKGVN